MSKPLLGGLEPKPPDLRPRVLAAVSAYHKTTKRRRVNPKGCPETKR